MTNTFKYVAACAFALTSLSGLADTVPGAAAESAAGAQSRIATRTLSDAGGSARWTNCSGADHPASRMHVTCPGVNLAVQGLAVRPFHPAAR